MSQNSFNARATLTVGNKHYTYYRLHAAGDVSRLPFSLKILLENLLRREDGETVTRADIDAIVENHLQNDRLVEDLVVILSR